MRLRLLFFLVLPMVAPFPAQSQSRVNLDDVKIDGELQKEGMSLSSRQRFDIEDEFEVRKSFRDLVLENLPPGYQRIDTAKDDSPAKNAK